MYKLSVFKSRILYPFFFTLLCFVFVPSPFQAAEQQSLQILFSGNIQGETEPCG